MRPDIRGGFSACQDGMRIGALHSQASWSAHSIIALFKRLLQDLEARLYIQHLNICLNGDLCEHEGELCRLDMEQQQAW